MLSDDGMDDRFPKAAGLHLTVLVDGVGGDDRLSPCRTECVEGGTERQMPAPCSDLRVDPVVCCMPSIDGCQLRINCPRPGADRRTQCRPLLLGGHRQGEPLVGPGARVHKSALLSFSADQLAEVCEAADTGDLRKDLLTVFEPLAEQSYGDGPLAVLAPTFIAEAAHDRQMRTFLADSVVRRRSGALIALRRARQRGELRPGVNINLTGKMIAGALSDRAYLLGKPVSSAYVRSVIDQAIAGIAAERSS